MTHVGDLDDDAYDTEIDRVQREDSVEAAISLALRESRLVSYRFPPYSSGAGDMIAWWLRDLREEWRREDERQRLEDLREEWRR